RAWSVRLLAATAVTAFVAAVLAPPLAEATLPGNGPRLQQALDLLLALAVVALVYLGCAWILRLPELSDSQALIAHRFPPLRRLAATPKR
ncbi:MAG: hypothetical protein ACRDJC_09945, partial [Thermomicrobiales bacterium]